ncbi:hypothetical protein CQA49_09865, partial [Helicobacter sp. MIT 00-7814]
YWNAWDREFKRGAIERLRTEKGTNVLTFNKQPIYPNITQDMQADLIEKGELKVVNLRSIHTTVAIWADENREEAKNPVYQEYIAKVKAELVKDKGNRIVS